MIIINRIFNSKGLSLVETMMALGISTIVIGGISSAIVHMQKGLSQQEDKLAVIESKREIINAIQSESTCTSLLNGSVLSEKLEVALGSIAKGAGVNPRVVIDSQFVENISAVGSGPNTYKSHLVTQYKSSNGKVIYKPHTATLYYTVNGTGQLTKCSGSETQALQANCVSSSGVWDPSTDSCDIVTPVCDSLGGTMNAGKCEGVGEDATPIETCNGMDAPRSDTPYSTARMTGSRSSQTRAGTCRLGTGVDGAISTGSCLPGTDTDYLGSCGGGGKCYRSEGGSCQYQCLRGSWIKINNGCFIKYK